MSELSGGPIKGDYATNGEEIYNAVIALIQDALPKDSRGLQVTRALYRQGEAPLEMKLGYGNTALMALYKRRGVRWPKGMRPGLYTETREVRIAPPDYYVRELHSTQRQGWISGETYGTTKTTFAGSKRGEEIMGMLLDTVVEHDSICRPRNPELSVLEGQALLPSYE